ncbi:hypothetical protein BDQ12DRAFT_297172 [Crucibulum laeve]|uniref:Uncharacterized protein n=1 Tax=Crucibulum laeve TaxID=68775 RepID=A0A5C3MNX4_9AGAR|nr:hypothetical protein BDQ12DRAFT_297172 [Crucibulum laeve]
MGSLPSKAARKLPKRTETPSWAGARTPHPDHLPTGRSAASETRTEAIEKDAGDPHFLANLNRLGPVKVDHHMKTVRAEAETTHRLFKSRAQSEFEGASSQPTKNFIHAPSLSELLDERKGAKTREDLEILAEKYGIDVERMENLTRFVNTPSVDRGATVKTVGKDGDESIIIPAVWIEPSIKESPVRIS